MVRGGSPVIYDAAKRSRFGVLPKHASSARSRNCFAPFSGHSQDSPVLFHSRRSSSLAHLQQKGNGIEEMGNGKAFFPIAMASLEPANKLLRLVNGVAGGERVLRGFGLFLLLLVRLVLVLSGDLVGGVVLEGVDLEGGLAVGATDLVLDVDGGMGHLGDTVAMHGGEYGGEADVGDAAEDNVERHVNLSVHAGELLRRDIDAAARRDDDGDGLVDDMDALEDVAVRCRWGGSAAKQINRNPWQWSNKRDMQG